MNPRDGIGHRPRHERSSLCLHATTNWVSLLVRFVFKIMLSIVMVAFIGAGSASAQSTQSKKTKISTTLAKSAPSKKIQRRKQKAQVNRPPAKPVRPGPSLLIDARSGEVLHQDRAGEPWYPASLTKLMTGYVVFQKIRANAMRLDQELLVSERASSQEPSKLGIPAGKTINVDLALQAMLVYSANDMAYVLAEGAGGSIEKFAEEMNAAARNLGLTATHFVNPNGLFDPRQVTSARDMAVLAAVIMAEFPEHARFFNQEYVAVGKRRLANRNSLVRTMPEADGMKTGFVCASGFNLVASASRNGRRLISVVMGARNSGQRAAAAQQLLEDGFAGNLQTVQGRVGEVLNLPQGSIVPVDMTGIVCRNKGPMEVQDPALLAGWAASFGTYESLDKAELALRGRVLSPSGIRTTGKTGVVKMAGTAGYAPLIWNLSQTESLNICKSYREEGAHCEVLPQSMMEQMASSAKALRAPVPNTTEQGADAEPAPPLKLPKAPVEP
jgi:D-alanyl-D-alanine carboxypeptidase